MPNPATRQLLRRHAVAFGTTFVSLTTLLLANYAVRRLPEMRASGLPTGAIVEAVLLVVWWRSRGPGAPRGAESLAIGV